MPSNVSTSSTASARLKAKADEAALMERLNALKRKHHIEAQEEELRLKQEQLRKEKEQFALETELAAANAKINKLDMSSKYGSKSSDGMNSYLEKSKVQEPAQSSC